ncbi:YqaA family protein [Halanaeroarchaeum sulfurireducens]|nr:VTT domain-containing protein [Halanaeroarchaeum sulfurireducens]
MSIIIGIGAMGFDPLEAAIRTASGLSGMILIFVYSVLISFALPLPSEVVLCPVGYVCGGNTLALGLPIEVQLAAVILISALGKSLGSVFALAIGHNASHSSVVIRGLRRLGLRPKEWSQRRMVALVKRWGYAGMAIGLSVPFFPDTISLYGFSILEDDYVKFAGAAFAGSVGRLLVTIGLIEGSLLVFW